MELTFDYLVNRHLKIKICCLPYQCNPIIYPIAVLAICTVLNGFCIQVLIGILDGVFYYYYAKVGIVKCIRWVPLEEVQQYDQVQNDLEKNAAVNS